MSVVGQKRRFCDVRDRSALHPNRRHPLALYEATQRATMPLISLDTYGFSSSSQMNSCGAVDIAFTRLNTSCMCGDAMKSFTA